jgi:hypothetical protein
MYIDFKIGTTCLEQFSFMDMTREQYEDLHFLFNNSKRLHKILKTLPSLSEAFNVAKKEIDSFDIELIKTINNIS